MAEPDFAEFGHNLPYSLEAEQSVLGSILLNADLLTQRWYHPQGAFPLDH